MEFQFYLQFNNILHIKSSRTNSIHHVPFPLIKSFELSTTNRSFRTNHRTPTPCEEIHEKIPAALHQTPVHGYDFFVWSFRLKPLNSKALKFKAMMDATWALIYTSEFFLNQSRIFVSLNLSAWFIKIFVLTCYRR